MNMKCSAPLTMTKTIHIRHALRITFYESRHILNVYRINLVGGHEPEHAAIEIELGL
jgi:hypothetical protein